MASSNVILALFLFLQYFYTTISDLQCRQGCKSQIYCEGDLLRDVQLAEVYNNSKAFVDQRLLTDEKTILTEYQKLKTSNSQLTKQRLKNFLGQYFASDDLEKCELKDFNENPVLLQFIVDENYKKWAQKVIKIWNELAGRIPSDVHNHPDRHSYLYIPNCFIKAGGFFTEMYYWDSYWIIKGLLLSDMYYTARGMIENFFYLVNSLGYMPNGNRLYYYGRSQPPLLTKMVEEYYWATRDEIFLHRSLKILEKELLWWVENRMVKVQKNGKTYSMFRYNVEICLPRPEGFKTDYQLGEQISNSKDREMLFVALRSAAESGWDFSTREMRPRYRNSDEYSLLNLDTQHFIMVDLNSIIQYNFARLGEWHEYFKFTEKSAAYKAFAEELLLAIEQVLYDEEYGVWFDWDITTETPRNTFYPSNLTPLWTRSYRTSRICPNKILQYLINEQLISQNLQPFYYGILTSKKNSTQQWDCTNAWAPLQSIVIEGLRLLNDVNCEQVALSLSKIWLKTNYEGFQKSGHMFEKYSAIRLGENGNGGEYISQIGFGWSNGFVLSLLRMFGDRVLSTDFDHFEGHPPP